MSAQRVAIVGGGPAGLMAAETARALGAEVDLYDAMGSVGRKFLLAGKGGLNLTHSDPFETFVSRYRGREEQLRPWLQAFDANALREFARGLGIETFVGTSGRVFPVDLKAAPFMRGWVRRLRAQGVRLHMHHRFTDVSANGGLITFATDDGERQVETDALVLACGGGSWPELGADGAWIPPLAARDVGIAPLRPSNCGFETDWSPLLRERHAGAPLKRIAAHLDGDVDVRVGECVISAYGLEGSLVYALSAAIRERIDRDGRALLCLDLLPDRSLETLVEMLAKPVGKRSVGEHLRRQTGLDAAKSTLLFERLPRSDWTNAGRVAAAIKRLEIPLLRARPIAEAISSAGGVRFDALSPNLMLRALPGVFCAGEMIDWEAPTGGYLLTACFASGLIAGRAAAAWRKSRH